MLQTREHGTFLIRWSSGKQQYALSIKCGNEVGHCLIFRYKCRTETIAILNVLCSSGAHGYGFAEPYNIYATLLDLVLHYAVNSLEEHNDRLKTTLMFPVGAPSPQESAYIPPEGM